MAILPKAIVRKKDKGGMMLPDIKLYYKDIITKKHGTKNQTYRSMTQNREPRKKPTPMW